MPPTARCHPGCPWLDLAVGLVGLGYVRAPVGTETRPLVTWADCPVARPPWRVLYNEWWPAWERASGVGLVTGGPHDLVVVDADSALSWQRALDNLPAVRGVKTSRGGHL